MTDAPTSTPTPVADDGVDALVFDEAAKFGARDHYFHFLLGYALPALNLVLARGLENTAVFVDCGPLMNPILAEACTMTGVTYRREPARQTGTRVPRWDTCLHRPGGSLLTPAEMSDFEEMTGNLRGRLLDCARSQGEKAGHNRDDGKATILVINRSPQHPYYDPDGGCHITGYGTGRRAMVNAAEIAATLSLKGYRARVITPGALPLWEQIYEFNQAAFVIGARGAEFANLFWMRPQTSALMFATPLKTENHASRSLAQICDIRFMSPKVDNAYFAADIGLVETCLDEAGLTTR